MVNNLIYNIKFLSNNNFFNKRLLSYIIIGIISILCELFLRTILISIFDVNFFSNIVSLFFGIAIAFYLNFFFNFKIPRLYFFYSLFFFFIISITSYVIQIYLKDFLQNTNMGYNFSRFIYSGVVFIIIYYFHINISFRYSVKVGLAIYLIKNEDIDGIYKMVDLYPDFIHLDLIDNTFNENHDVPYFDNLKKIKYLWPTHKIHTHIMSKNPIDYIEKIRDISDLIYIHYETYLDNKKYFDDFNKITKKLGIVFHVKNTYKNIKNILPQNINELLILTISNPGVSGQKFENKSFELIKSINLLPQRKRIKVTVDGGINEKLIYSLNCERVVSNSSILKSSNPKKQIINFQAFSKIKKNDI